MRLTSLHFLRAMGAIFIVISHSHGVIRKRFESLEFTDYFWQVEQGYTKVFGALGVDLFLVLSGFFAFIPLGIENKMQWIFLKKDYSDIPYMVGRFSLLINIVYGTRSLCQL
ncbi:acyltransferase family protein [Psychromonas sp. KJ10-2]|uniref:acyltransferase family protein n=1 Tax=Psychromonas sp. KJ10-2 TaxID=3391822 RepID=UPI0039B44A92